MSVSESPTPKPDSTVEAPPAPKTFKVTGVASDDVLYIRHNPGNVSSYVDKIPPDGNAIKIVGASRKLGKNIWVLIEYNGKRGWVNRRFLGGE